MIFGGTVLYPVRCIGAMGQLGMMDRCFFCPKTWMAKLIGCFLFDHRCEC